LVSGGASCLNLFQPFHTVASTAASASLSVLSVLTHQCNISTYSRVATSPRSWNENRSGRYGKSVWGCCIFDAEQL